MRINDIASRALKSVLHKVNELGQAVWTKEELTSSTVQDEYTMLLKTGPNNTDFKKLPVSDLVTFVDSNSTLELPEEEELLREWTQGKDYEPESITRDSEGRVTSMTVKWVDESTGLYVATDYNATHEAYDGYYMNHDDSGLTVTQSAVTRNIDGAVITKPNLTVA